ncbi:MAG: gliding motility protein GldM [Flavobacteriales bacterium]|nr:gliding motility protein GldM [Flavobacteriales bacterium]
MSGGDLPPRQKMIGMMYLVLTALLALNISKSILDAFVNINSGIQTTAISFDANNQFIYNAFDKAAATGGANGKKWAAKAEKVKKLANHMYDHIENLKKKMYAVTDGIEQSVADTIKLSMIDGKDNYDAPTHLMGLADPGNPIKLPGEEQYSGIVLKEELNKYRKGILNIFDDKNVKDEVGEKIAYLATPKIKTDDGEDEWEVGLFYHVPLAAAVCALSKIQSDIRTSEAEVIARLYERIDAGGVSFNKIQGMAVLPKGYILDGDTFRADIFTAAYDDRVDPEIYVYSTEAGGVDSAAWLKGETDIAKLMKGTKGNAWGEGDWYEMSKDEIKAGKGSLMVKEGVGVHNWGGLIKLKTKKGPKVYPFSSSFEVGKPSTTVAATAMNVFYMGIDNPVSVSAPMPNFKASAPGLRAKGGSGEYIMRPSKTGKVTVNVTGTDENGKTVSLGKQEFRVKRIPTPVAYIGGKTGTIILSKSQLGNGVINAKLEGFVFDLRVKVKSFTLGTTQSGDYKSVKVTGNKMSSKCKSMIKRGSRGQRFYLEKMSVKMPDGRTVELGNVTIKLR